MPSTVYSLNVWLCFLGGVSVFLLFPLGVRCVCPFPLGVSCLCPFTLVAPCVCLFLLGVPCVCPSPVIVSVRLVFTFCLCPLDGPCLSASTVLGVPCVCPCIFVPHLFSVYLVSNMFVCVHLVAIVFICVHLVTWFCFLVSTGCPMCLCVSCVVCYKCVGKCYFCLCEE